MTDYQYTAKTLTGKRVAGSIEAESEAAVLRVLEEEQLFPIEVVSKREPAALRGRGRVRARDLGLTYGQLADLLQSGVPLLRALDSIARSAVSRRLTRLVREIHDDVAEGKSLHESLRARPDVFPLLHVAMVQAGERASFLEEVLYSLASFIERIDDLQGKVRGSMIYPALLSALGVAVMLSALIFFVPRFEPLLEGVDKPLPTLIIFELSGLVRGYWELVLVALAAGVWGLVSAFRSKVGRDLFETWRMRLPVVGTALRMVAITRFCRILGTMLANGVPLLQALAISRDATGSSRLAALIDDAIENVRAGEPLTSPLAEGGFFPPQILAMLSIAEESNQLQKVLVQIADTVERRTHRQVDQAVRLLEPMILCVVAVAIGFLALSLLLPIFTLAGSLGAS